MRRTKIVATVGPSSSDEDILRRLVAAGVDVFRLNFSHGTHEEHAESVRRIRAAAEAEGRCVAILQDLSGPKIRTGPLAGGVPLALAPGEDVILRVGEGPGGPGLITTPYAALPGAVHADDTLLLDDGRIELRVKATRPGEISATVVAGGPLGEHKGINAPGVPLPADALTAKDIEDLAFGVERQVDFVALSFVRGADDLRQARAALTRLGAPQLPVVAKLERPEAVERLEEILTVCEAVMVARGDLGLELPLEQVPRIQKEITRRARAAGIPVIVATQVLESMLASTRPTRAEVSDAANAVEDGVDAIMLAGETAIGGHPERAVRTLDAVIRDAETLPSPADHDRRRASDFPGIALFSGHGRAICEAAITLAERGEAHAIVAVTRGGKTARLLSALRPRAPVHAATDRPAVARRLALSRGVVPVPVHPTDDLEAAARGIGPALVEQGAIPAAGVIVLVSISPDLGRQDANFLRLQRV